MNEDMKIMREVSDQAERFYDDAQKLGDHAARIFALGTRRRSQMTGLENIAETTLKTSDVFDYIKKQIARFEDWRRGLPENENPNEGFGESLKKYLEDGLSRKRDQVCLAVGVSKSDIRKRQEVYLLLIRQFIRQVVVQYEYRVTLIEKERSDGSNKRAKQ